MSRGHCFAGFLLSIQVIYSGEVENRLLANVNALRSSFFKISCSSSVNFARIFRPDSPWVGAHFL
jgi:hypothetical protein